VLAAIDRLALGEEHAAFLCPDPRSPGDLIRVTVTACRNEAADHLWAILTAVPAGDLRGLTQRQLQILGLMIEGWPRFRIGARPGSPTNVDRCSADRRAGRRSVALNRWLDGAAFRARVTIDIAEIAMSLDSSPDRADAVLHAIGRFLPFVALLDPDGRL
jgi:hypothetical protein